MALLSYSHPLTPPRGSTTPPTSPLPQLDQACHINRLWTASAHAPACPMSSTTPAHVSHHPISLASWVIAPTRQPPLSDLLGGYRLLAPQTPMSPTTLLLAGATTSGCLKTSLAQEPTCPLSLLSLAHEPSQKTSLTRKAREPANHTSPSYSRERFGRWHPCPWFMGRKCRHRQHCCCWE